MSVQWNHNCHSSGFSVSNGVQQGGVLSPFLFAVYLDSLLKELSLSGVGCRWRWMFAGVSVLRMILFCWHLVPPLLENVVTVFYLCRITWYNI